MAKKTVSTNSEEYFSFQHSYSVIKDNPMAIVLFTYIVGLLFTRFFVILKPDSQVWVAGLHLHHYYLGLISIVFSAGIPLYYGYLKYEILSAVLFGLGMGILIDETGLLLTKGSNYWSPMTYPFIFAFFFIFMFSMIAQYHNRKKGHFNVSVDTGKQAAFTRTPFLMALLSYLMWFSFARCFTIINPDFRVYVGDVHLQHFYLGILFLIASGWLVLYYRCLAHRVAISFLYGGGLGLIINQLAELLTESDYWHPLTWPFFIFFLLLLLGLTFMSFFTRKNAALENG
ncbi:MAG: hypothetical protein ACTSVM_04280 [Candidatus Ranarchaeia archaeon]